MKLFDVSELLAPFQINENILKNETVSSAILKFFFFCDLERQNFINSQSKKEGKLWHTGRSLQENFLVK